MRIFPLILAMFTAALVLGAADVPAIPAEDKTEKPAVAETGKLLELTDPAQTNRANTPPGVLGSQAAKPGVVYEWTPSPDQTRITGGADLIDAFLAPDETLLVLLEKVGGKDGPNSTRVLCWNLLNDRLVRAFRLADRKLAAAAPLPGSPGFVASQRAQKEFDQPDRLVTVDLLSGKIDQESQPLNGAVRSFAVGRKLTCAAVEGEENILVFSTRNFSEPPQPLRTLVPEPRLLLSPNGAILAVYGKGRLEAFNTDTESGLPEMLSSRELPEDFTPVFGLLPFDSADTLILADASGKALLFSNRMQRQLTDQFSGIACHHAADRKLFLCIKPKESISLYQLPNETTPSVTVSPGELRPISRNDNFRLFTLAGSGEPELLLIDNRANILRLSVLPRRWKKSVLFSAPQN